MNRRTHLDPKLEIREMRPRPELFQLSVDRSEPAEGSVGRQPGTNQLARLRGGRGLQRSLRGGPERRRGGFLGNGGVLIQGDRS